MAPKAKQKDKVLTEEEQALHDVHEDIIHEAVNVGVSAVACMLGRCQGQGLGWGKEVGGGWWVEGLSKTAAAERAASILS